MRLLLDMDEVLVDFVGGALWAHGWTREQLEEVWPAGTWSIVKSMGLTIDEWWAPIDALGEKFWLRLQPTPWIEELLHLVDHLTDDWHIVTSPSPRVSCYTGKVRWLKRYFGQTFSRFAITPHKEIFANPRALLLDDREENVTRFQANGGSGVVFPSRHNYLHLEAADPVGYLKNYFRVYG